MIKRRRKGSAALYVMVMLVIMTTVTLAYATLGTAGDTSETRREQAVIARLAFDGATLKAAYDAGLGKISIPSTNIETVGPYSCSVTVADNSTNLTHSLSMSSTATLESRTFRDTRITALKMPVSPFFYTLASNTNLAPTTVLTTGASSINGDLYCTGNVSLTSGSTINGYVEATGSITSTGSTINGTALTAVRTIPLPSVTASNYSAVASSSLINILLGVLLSGETFTTPYMVIYTQGTTTMNGIFTGKGVVFVNGNVTINGDMTYLLPSDEVAVIVQGNVTVSGKRSICGYWYCSGTFSTSNTTTLSRGCIVANAFSLGGALTATYDPTIFSTPGEALRLKLPGFWP